MRPQPNFPWSGDMYAFNMALLVSGIRHTQVGGGKFAFNYNLPLGGQTRLLRPNGRAILNYSSIFHGFPKTI